MKSFKPVFTPHSRRYSLKPQSIITEVQRSLSVMSQHRGSTTVDMQSEFDDKWLENSHADFEIKLPRIGSYGKSGSHA
jgi:hypothetical protein